MRYRTPILKHLKPHEKGLEVFQFLGYGPIDSNSIANRTLSLQLNLVTAHTSLEKQGRKLARSRPGQPRLD